MARHMRRKTFWLGKAISYVTVPGGTSHIILATSAQIHETTEDPTLIRMIGRLWFAFERNTEFAESMRSICHMGISCVHEDMPLQNPKGDISEELWMWQGLAVTQATFVEYPDRQNAADTIIGGSTESRASQHVPTGIEHVDLDIRAMRKAPLPCEVRLSMDVAEVMAATASTNKIAGVVRMLFKV